MLIYYLRLAAASIVKTPVISTITVMAIGLGISVSTTMITLKHVFAQNPIPHKSEQLFNVRLDSWSADGSVTSWKDGDPPKQVTYQDMNRIRKSDIPVRQSAVATVRVTAFPAEKDQQPLKPMPLCVTGTFSPCLKHPFFTGRRGPTRQTIPPSPWWCSVTRATNVSLAAATAWAKS